MRLPLWLDSLRTVSNVNNISNRNEIVVVVTYVSCRPRSFVPSLSPPFLFLPSRHADVLHLPGSAVPRSVKNFPSPFVIVVWHVSAYKPRRTVFALSTLFQRYGNPPACVFVCV